MGTVISMRTTAGRRRVDVVYRRVDDDYLDHVQFRPDSSLGAPGLITVARLGNVTLANAVGNGVADDKLVYTYLPDLMRYYLGEDPILPNVETYLLGEEDQRAYVLERLDRLVVKAVGESGGYDMLIGPHSTAAEREQFRQRILSRAGRRNLPDLRAADLVATAMRIQDELRALRATLVCPAALLPPR